MEELSFLLRLFRTVSAHFHSHKNCVVLTISGSQRTEWVNGALRSHTLRNSTWLGVKSCPWPWWSLDPHSPLNIDYLFIKILLSGQWGCLTPAGVREIQISSTLYFKGLPRSYSIHSYYQELAKLPLPQTSPQPLSSGGRASLLEKIPPEDRSWFQVGGTLYCLPKHSHCYTTSGLNLDSCFSILKIQVLFWIWGSSPQQETLNGGSLESSPKQIMMWDRLLSHRFGNR